MEDKSYLKEKIIGGVGASLGFIALCILGIFVFLSFFVWIMKDNATPFLLSSAAFIGCYFVMKRGNDTLKKVFEDEKAEKEAAEDAAAAEENLLNYYKNNDALLERAGLNENAGGIFIGHRACYENGRFFAGRPLRYLGDRHLLTFGPTGSGKGATAQIPALLDQKNTSSAFVIDVKGQLAAVTSTARERCGHKIAVINPFDVLNIPTATYNPLKHLQPLSPSFAADCRRIAEGLVNVEKADHWELSALDVVTLLIMWTVIFEDEKDLITVRRLLNQTDSERIVFFETMRGCPHPQIAEGATRYMADSKEVKDCIQTAVVQLGFLRDAGIERVLRGGGKEVSFAELKRQRMTVYLIIPPELLHTHGRFLRLLVMSALNELFKERTNPESPVLFMLDEFAQLGAMPIIENAASIVRDYKIRLWPILQNIPQLKTLYGQKWESFLSSAGILQFFTPNDLETAKYISDRSGTRIVMKKSTSSGMSKSTGGANGSVSSSQSESYTEAKEPVLSVQEVFDRNASSQMLFAPNVGTVMVSARIPYYKQEELKALAAPDPYNS